MILILAAVIGAAVVALVRRFAREVDRSVWGGLVVIVGAGALGAVVFDAAPTGTAVVDAVLRAGFVAAAAAAGSIAHRVGLLVSSAIAVAVLLDATARLDWAAAGALGGSIVLAVTLAKPHGARCSGAAVGTALACMALTIEWTPTGLPSLAAVAILVPTVVAAWWFARTRTRRITAAVVSVLAGAAVLASAGATFAAVMARDALVDAVDDARDGLDVLGADADRTEASLRIERASTAFADGSRTLGSWYAKPGLAVPIVAQHLRAATELSDAGQALTEAASEVLDALDPARLRPESGRIDLTALGGLGDALVGADEAMTLGRQRLDGLDDPWLVGLLTDRRDEFTAELADAQERTKGVRDALTLVRSMLGESEPRRYLLAVQTLSESRATGGWWGNWGFVEADGGQLELTALGRILELSPPQAFDLSGLPAEYLQRYSYIGLTEGIGRMNVSPDMPTVGQAVSTVFPQIGRGDIDGIIAIDPYGLASVLQITGPITVAGWPEPISVQNAPQVLLFDTYNTLEGDARVDAIGTVAAEAWRALLAADTTDLRNVVDALRPAVQAKHIQLYATREDEQAQLERLQLAGKMPTLTGDGLSVVTQNLSASKVDWFLTRDTSYDVTVDPATGTVEATVRVTLTNTAPSSGLADEVIGYLDRSRPELTGTNRTWVTVYSPLVATEATLDGRTFPITGEPELGRFAYPVTAVVPPDGGEAVVELRLRGTFVPGTEYRLDFGRQPLARPEQVTVTVRPADGWQVDTSSLPVTDGLASGSIDTLGDAAITASFVPAD